MDSAHTEAEPPFAKPVAYRTTKTVEQRLDKLERELRVFQVAGTVLAVLAVLMAWAVAHYWLKVI